MAITGQLGGDWNWVHVLITFFTTGAGFSLLAQAVNTFPVPENPYGRWLLGMAQSFIGMKGRSVNTFANQDTVAMAVPKKADGK
jgi:hypothetical protein